MRGLYAHASDRMRDDLRAALQARWDESLRERAAIHPHSPVPLLDELLAPHRETAHRKQPPTRRVTRHHNPAPGGREKMISQIPPNQPESPARTTRARPSERASDLVRHENRGVELRGFEPLTPSMRMRICCSNGFEPISPFRVKCQVECQMTVSDRVAQ
jgi:hypothetical protein